MSEHPFRSEEIRQLCEVCRKETPDACAVCKKPLCQEHLRRCKLCGEVYCDEHLRSGPWPAALWRGHRCSRCDGSVNAGYRNVLLLLVGGSLLISVLWSLFFLLFDR